MHISYLISELCSILIEKDCICFLLMLKNCWHSLTSQILSVPLIAFSKNNCGDAIVEITSGRHKWHYNTVQYYTLQIVEDLIT